MEIPRPAYQVSQITSRFYTLECVGILFQTYQANRVRIDIYKEVLIDDSMPRRKRARTVGYSYNANTPHGQNLIRYDSPDPPHVHGPQTPYHHMFHHKHDYTVHPPKVTRVDDDQYPHVGEFIEEVLMSF